jgi:hypothetical protein
MKGVVDVFSIDDLQDNEQSIDILKSILKSNKLSIFHPENSAVTYARQSKRVGMANVVLLTDLDGNNRWHLVQVTKFIDGFITSNTKVQFDNKPVVDFAIKHIINDGLIIDLDNNFNVDGFILSQTRPYHFMYDQYVNLFELPNEDCLEKKLYTDDTCFIRELPGGSCFKKSERNGCYLFPTMQSDEYIGNKSELMRSKLLEHTETVEYNQTEIAIWFGITGQKRSWLEQVESCVYLANKIIENYETLTLVIDGWTCYEGEVSNNSEDTTVFHEIHSQLKTNSKIKVVSLIDMDYKSKISYGKNIDFFIANSGSGSLIPHAICRKKGVVHGKLRTFKKLYDDAICVIPKNKMFMEESGTIMNDSYSFHWSVAYNLLLRLGLKGKAITEVKPSLASKLEFSNLRFELQNEAADILRDIALKFEKCGDIKTALILMKKAQEQRPGGPYINNKIREYEKILY